MTCYKISWSNNGATCFRSFHSREERDNFRKQIETKNTHVDVWDNNYEEVLSNGKQHDHNGV